MFLMWSIAEAWNWLIHVPVLGFLFLIALPVAIVFLIAAVIDLANSN